MTQGCSGGADALAASSVPEPKNGVQSLELMDLVHQSDRPFVLINFFATWCRPCRAELPELVALQNDPQSEVKVLLVSIDKAPEIQTKLRPFLAENGVNFQTYARPDNEQGLIQELYPIWDNRIPLSLIYSKEGRLLEALRGMTDRSEIELLVNKHKRIGE